MSCVCWTWPATTSPGWTICEAWTLWRSLTCVATASLLWWVCVCGCVRFVLYWDDCVTTSAVVRVCVLCVCVWEVCVVLGRLCHYICRGKCVCCVCVCLRGPMEESRLDRSSWTGSDPLGFTLTERADVTAQAWTNSDLDWDGKQLCRLCNQWALKTAPSVCFCVFFSERAVCVLCSYLAVTRTHQQPLLCYRILMFALVYHLAFFRSCVSLQNTSIKASDMFFHLLLTPVGER